ncbi:hypothetical protein [Bacteriovorax sp. Seq25_V]|uniref:hypothetical protein n=1 Tax=Bacteriovorax sp. Seq25_V TaxID=1201288 RepID=UPI00038A3B7D|nr:hypothetical protein [Bacteriovorax sp. Seq25_V]EQC45279.1 hypothetical protein M900_1970 [Bacteriovorax sp. Seq25_V]
MKEFAKKVISNLEANGFPAKKVSLPTEKMFEVADEKGFSFNAVIDHLKADYQIMAEIGAEKIIFSKEAPVNKENMFKQAQEMMANMDPEELKRMQDMIMNMSPEQKDELMKKGKEMGLI